MSKADSAVREFMTPMPHGIDPHETLHIAQRRMEELKVRHLPVRSGGKVVGVISERDLYMLAAFKEIDFKKATVAIAMTPDPYCVSENTPVRDVAAHMAAQRIGSALVTNAQSNLLGIFTETDALRLLAYT